MKYLLALLLALVVVWYWRSTRAAKPLARKPAQPQAPSAMVACQHCGVHLPAPEAVTGARGPYCSSAHRQLAEP